MTERVALELIERGITDLRILLLNRLSAERRTALVDELEALRFARIGVERQGQREVLIRHGVGPGLRPPVLRRGPEVWGDATRVTRR